MAAAVSRVGQYPSLANVTSSRLSLLANRAHAAASSSAMPPSKGAGGEYVCVNPAPGAGAACSVAASAGGCTGVGGGDDAGALPRGLAVGAGCTRSPAFGRRGRTGKDGPESDGNREIPAARLSR